MYTTSVRKQQDSSTHFMGPVLPRPEIKDRQIDRQTERLQTNMPHKQRSKNLVNISKFNPAT